MCLHGLALPVGQAGASEVATCLACFIDMWAICVQGGAIHHYRTFWSCNGAKRAANNSQPSTENSCMHKGFLLTCSY
jgi:hypothetical protein